MAQIARAALKPITKPLMTFSGIPVLGIDQDIVRTFADVKAQLRKQGSLIEDLDLLIAATARTHGLILVTNNVGHYSRIPGLLLENWINP